MKAIRMVVHGKFVLKLMLTAICVEAQGYFEERHKYQFATQMAHLKEIPKRFEVKGENAIAEFKKYINDIQSMARKENVTLAYRIKVEVVQPKKIAMKRDLLKKIRTMKYKIPLKKKSMKLSNFEMILRQRVNEHVNQKSYEERPMTTEKQHIILSTKPASLGKYKPILSHVKTNYTKVIRPVRNKEITLFV